MTVHFVSSPSAVSFLSIVRVGTFLRLLHSRHHHTTFFPRSTVHTERSSPDLMNCCVREEQHPRLITSLRLKNQIIETMYWFHSYGHYICQTVPDFILNYLRKWFITRLISVTSLIKLVRVISWQRVRNADSVWGSSLLETRVGGSFLIR